MIKKILKSSGIDSSIFWSIMNKGLSVIKGPLSLYFLIRYLSPSMQGIWYTFGSLGTLTIFAELGFLTIVTQFVSHEFAFLKKEDLIIVGEEKELDRFFGLIKFAIRFYSLVIPTAVIILCIVGYFFFKNENQIIKIAWYLFSIVGGIDLMLSLLQSIYSGLNNVSQAQINLFICSLLGTVANWAMLICNFNIWALVAGNLIGVIIAFIVLYLNARSFWRQLFLFRVKRKYEFLKETLPLQGKYAVSWISAFFILYLLVPAAYQFKSKEEAGQLGMSIALITAVAGISNAWIMTKIPVINMYVARLNYSELDVLFKKSLIQSITIQIFLFIVVIFGLYILDYYFPSYSTRFLTIGDCILLILPQFPQLMINFYSVYLRAHKEEPLMWAILIQSILIVLCVAFILRSHELHTFLYFLNMIYWLFALPATYIIFKSKSKSYKMQNLKINE